MLFRVADIETVPDRRFWSGGEKRWRLLPADRRASGEESYTVSGDVRLCAEPQFAPPQAQRVVAVAWCDVEMDPASQPKAYRFVSCESRSDWAAASDTEAGAACAERGLVRRFRDAMVERPATLVTWNGRCFDLPVLAARALHLGVPWGWYYDDRDVRYRYSSSGHLDLMDFLSDYGACRTMKLDDAARLVGLPGKDVPGEEHFDGSMVEGVVARGDVAKNKTLVARYCLQDVLQTALVFLRTRYHLEIVTAEGHAVGVASFCGSPQVTEALPIDWSRLLLDAEVAG